MSCTASHFFQRLTHSGESRVSICSLRNVIKPNNGEVRRKVQTTHACRFHSTKSHDIVRDKGCCLVEQASSRDIGCRRNPAAAGKHSHIPDLDQKLSHDPGALFDNQSGVLAHTQIPSFLLNSTLPLEEPSSLAAQQAMMAHKAQTMLQATPLSLNEVGAVLVPLQAALKPGELPSVVPGAIDPL